MIQGAVIISASELPAPDGTLYTRVLEEMSEGFIVLDRDYRVLEINAAALAMNAMTREQIVGRSHWDVWPASVGTSVETAFRTCMDQRVPT